MVPPLKTRMGASRPAPRAMICAPSGTAETYSPYASCNDVMIEAVRPTCDAPRPIASSAVPLPKTSGPLELTLTSMKPDHGAAAIRPAPPMKIGAVGACELPPSPFTAATVFASIAERSVPFGT